MDNYAGITKRVAAFVVDAIIFLAFYLFILFILSDKPFAEFFHYIFSDTGTISTSIQGKVLETLLFIALETLMITKLGWTPGKLLFGVYIKDASTLKNAALMQVVMRSTLKALLFVPLYISDWFYTLPILVLIFVIFDQRKQTFYDKIVKTVVIDYKPEKYHLNLNYVGITRRAVAYIIDHFIIIGISLTFFSFIEMTFDPTRAELLTTCLFFLLSIIFGVFMIRRFSGTPGQLLCGIHIKDTNTLENVTLAQAIIRYVLFEAFNIFVPGYILALEEFYNEHNSQQWSGPLLTLTFVVIILIFISAIFDRSKQFFHDKIAKTVVIDYKPEKHHLDLNYVGITRRAVAYIIDRCTIMGIVSFCLIFVKIIFHPDKFTRLVVYISLFFLLSMVLGVFITRRFGSTPGQWLCRICIKNINTLKNITLLQAIIRYVLFEIINFILIFMLIINLFFFETYTSKWWFEPLSILTSVAIILIFICAIFDRRKQFFHDKIAKTVAIDYKPSS
ncbi:MAG: RDD family protein [Wolbachia sp.]